MISALRTPRLAFLPEKYGVPFTKPLLLDTWLSWDDPMATSQDFVNWVCAKELDHDFLKYLFIAEGGDLLRFASGSVHQTIYFPRGEGVPYLSSGPSTNNAESLVFSTKRSTASRLSKPTLKRIFGTPGALFEKPSSINFRAA